MATKLARVPGFPLADCSISSLF